ncbi:response regulator [Streptomyces gossypii]|uniref:response regulator n=1 Tax=Streptomyces gossypii TaxID=2883101 RepID=UPI0035CD0E87
MLVVDDNKVIRQLIKVNLELEGFEVVTADDGAECLEIVHRIRPDVITLDVVMPRLDGLRTAERLRADPRTRHIRVAIVSACTRAEIGVERSSGVDAVLAKPFEPAALVRMVRRLARGAQRGAPSLAGVPELSELPGLSEDGMAGGGMAGDGLPGDGRQGGGSGSAVRPLG